MLVFFFSDVARCCDRPVCGLLGLARGRDVYDPLEGGLWAVSYTPMIPLVAGGVAPIRAV